MQNEETKVQNNTEASNDGNCIAGKIYDEIVNEQKQKYIESLNIDPEVLEVMNYDIDLYNYEKVTKL